MRDNITAYAHIELDETGVPFVAGTTTKVVELVLDRLAYGWSPEELYLQHPHLTLGQIHSALAYYWDHQDELDADIQRRLTNMEQLRQSAAPTPLQDLVDKERRRQALQELEALAARTQSRNADLSHEEVEALADEIARETIARMVEQGRVRFESSLY